jgi:2'-5' RNA ligase
VDVRFVIITLPPEPTRQTMDALRRPLNQAVGAREALRYPPHVTLRTGLVCPDEKADSVAQEFLTHARAARAVPVETTGVFFTAYGEPGFERGLVGWSVDPSAPLLGLHQQLSAYQPWAKGPQGAFRPHVTLAFHDIGTIQVEALRQRIAAAPLPAFAWTIDHVALYYETPDGWVEWGKVEFDKVRGNMPNSWG